MRKKFFGGLKAFRARKNRYLFLRDDGKFPDLIVCSTGGVASTELLVFLGRNFFTNDSRDRDGLKHLPQPPLSALNRGKKVIFLYDNPAKVIASLRRRGILRNHAIKYSVLNLVRSERSLEGALRSALEKQIASFLRIRHGNLIALDYESVFESSERIALFLNQDPAIFSESFPRRKYRLSAGGL